MKQGSGYPRDQVEVLGLMALESRSKLQGQALAADIVLCFWARRFTLTVPLAT